MSDSSPIFPLLITGTATGIVSAGALLAYSVFAPRCQFWAPVVRSLPQREAVALTFDDGPHAEFTPRILDILAAAPGGAVRATFFVIGHFAKKEPAIIRRIAAEGHTLGNHSLDHDHFGVNQNRAYWDRQLGETQRIVADIAGSPPLVFRPPMGFKTWHIAAAAKALRLPVIGWSVRGFDARAMAAESLAKRVLRRTNGHDIVLLHDGIDATRAKRAGATQAHTVGALAAIVAGIQEKKLTIVPLLDALVAGAADRETAAARVRARAAT